MGEPNKAINRVSPVMVLFISSSPSLTSFRFAVQRLVQVELIFNETDLIAQFGGGSGRADAA
jgi:hypothetical protein